MVSFVVNQSIDIKKPDAFERSEPVRGRAGDNGTHQWNVTITSGSSRVDLSDCTCYASFTLPNGTKTQVNGTIKRNTCSVDLTSACYSVPGVVKAVMVLKNTTTTSIVRTVAACAFYIEE